MGNCCTNGNISPLYALAPELIPRLGALREPAKRYAQDSFLAICSKLNSPVFSPETIDRLGAAVAAIEISASAHDPAATGVKTAADAVAHDSYFHVVRVAGSAPQAFVRSVLQANLIFLEEVSQCGSALTRCKLECLGTALTGMVSYVVGGDTHDIQNSVRFVHWNALDVSRTKPIRRWIRGHHLFAMLTQGMILALQEMGGALRDERDSDVAAALDQIVVLLEGTSIAFQFAGDFSPSRYQDTVRPSMEPPITPEGFSGILSADHRHLVKLLHLLRPQLEAARNCSPGHYERFVEAFGRMYDSHKHVCSRFGGNERPSLLQSTTNCRTATQQLEQFKEMRMKRIP